VEIESAHTVAATRDEPVEGAAGEHFGSLLRLHRRAAGLTQEALAERSGLSVRGIRALELGGVEVPQRESVRVLVTALGLPEGPALRLEQAARAARGKRIGESVPGPGVWDLPATVADFTGREEELVRLRGLVSSAGRKQGGTVLVSAILGQGGIGKTVLALQVSHEVAGSFPDGRMYVDLRGVQERPADPGEVLGRFLAALGLPTQMIPAGLAERAAKFRAVTSRRRVLVVLDNAADEAQVWPLLPAAGAGCVAVVTSRNRLVGLETPHRLLLDVLDERDAVGLLAEIVGDRVAAEPEAAAEVVALCGCLPLAVRIAGNRLASRPGWNVAFLAGRLRDEQARLRTLRAGDLQVRAAFELSYRQAGAPARTLFRRLALVPGPDFGAGVAAVLADTDEQGAEALLAELADASLILPAPRVGRYRFHDLMRLFAAERLADEADSAEDGTSDRDAAEERMLAWLLDTAIRAGQTYLPPGMRKARTAAPGPPVVTHAEANDWLETERANWMGALRRAAQLGRHETVSQVSAALDSYHENVGHFDDARQISELAVQAARHRGDIAEETRQLNILGFRLWLLGDHQAAADGARRALAQARSGGDHRQVGEACQVLAAVAQVQGRFEEAMDYNRQALAAFRASGHRL
jgi:transcriptional regulator with XRE-family HTH domain/tetratricopeptide (TPR) repeat protein